MAPSQTTETTISVAVSNLGGITETQVDLDSGINVLSGRNATNRTSFLRAVMAALGSDRVSLKADATTGAVDLSLDGETYTRRLSRRGSTVTMDGDPYLTDSTVADLFAFLLESNEARRAVSRGEDLRELIMRPVDVETITAEIEAAEAEKRRLDRRLEELSGLAEDLPGLEAEKRRLAEAIEEQRAALDEKRAALEATDGSVEASRQDKQALDDALAELQSVQSAIEDVRFQLETERESREPLREELDALEADRESLPDGDADPEEIDARLAALRDRRAAVDSTASRLQSVIQFNEELLTGADGDVRDALAAVGATDGADETDGPESVGALTDDGDGAESDVVDDVADTSTTAPTDRLLDDEATTCWTCGSHVATAQIESTLEQLRALRRENLAERSDLADRIDELSATRSEYEAARRERQQLRRRIEHTETELEERAERIESLEADLADHRERATDLESTVETLDTDHENAVLDAHRAVTEAEFELSRLESEAEDVEERIDTIESQLEEREALRADREAVSERLTALRTRIERLEDEAVEAFNTHMDTVLETLDYDNLERIWIERTTEEAGYPTGGDVGSAAFRLHVVRSGPDGATYEDTIDHLSESEREVTGLVFALAGYLVHEVYEDVPIMVLDSLEAIDSTRIARLVEYFEEYAETILVALLPEDAAALDDSHHRVTDI
ncbi:MAG: archaea-specific SMC-related protein [Haloferacaceae archaeon]